MQSENPTQLDIAEMIIRRSIDKYPLMSNLVKVQQYSGQMNNEIQIQIGIYHSAIFVTMTHDDKLMVASPLVGILPSGDWKRRASTGGRRIVDLPWIYDNIYEPSFVGQFGADVSGLIYKLVKQYGNLP